MRENFTHGSTGRRWRRASQGVPRQRLTLQRENVVGYLSKTQQAAWRGKLQQAYRQPTYAAARATLERLGQGLRRLNADAARSLAEGLEETLTLHRLGCAERLGQSFLTTNMLESVLAQVEQRTGKVDRWTSSDQKQRWLAAALLDIEPRLRRVRGYRALRQLRTAIQATFTKAQQGSVA